MTNRNALFLLPLVVILSLASFGAQGPSHPITLHDILALREITEQQISPDGNAVAFVVKDTDLAANSYNFSLYVIPIDGKADPRLLLTGKSLSNVRWAQSSDRVAYISSEGKLSAVWTVDLNGSKPRQLIMHDENVTSFEWSPDGNTIALLSVPPVEESETAAAATKGIVLDDHSFFPFWDFVGRSWVKKPTCIWLYRVRENKLQKLWEQKPSIYHFENYSISRLVWAPDNEKIAVEYQTSLSTSLNAAVAFNSGVGVVSVKTGEFTPLPSTSAYQVGPSWSADSKALAFQTEISTQGKPRDGFKGSLFVHREGLAAASELTSAFDVGYATRSWWSQDGSKIIFAMEGYHQKTAIYELLVKDGSVRQISQTADHLSECTVSANRTTASCIRQNPMKAPEIAVVDLGDGTPKTLTHLNSAFDQITLGEVSKIQWKNKYGIETDGYLIKPIGYQPGQRYPFLLTLYHFEGKFITQAEWISSYPAQVFAANGFAVLLMNQPREYGWRYGNFEQFSFDRDYNALASIEAAVSTVVEMGVADSKRTGIMGWSYGSELTNLAITHTKLFTAASASSGGANNRGEYWLSGAPFQHYIEGTMGGSPYGDYDKRFDDLSSALHANRASSPLLIETPTEEMLFSLEFYSALRRLGKPVELVVYPDEGHIYSQPKHRLASMERNLDWFSFWLQGKEDRDPGKQDQYQRWRTMSASSIPAD